MFLLRGAGKAAGPGDCAKIAELMNLHFRVVGTLQATSLRVLKEITMLEIVTIS